MNLCVIDRRPLIKLSNLLSTIFPSQHLCQPSIPLVPNTHMLPTQTSRSNVADLSRSLRDEVSSVIDRRKSGRPSSYITRSDRPVLVALRGSRCCVCVRLVTRGRPVAVVLLASGSPIHVVRVKLCVEWSGCVCCRASSA